MLWFQGWDRAPDLCLQMLETWRLYNPGWEIRTISRKEIPSLLGESYAKYQNLRQHMSLGDKLGLSIEQRLLYGGPNGDGIIPPASESDLLRLYLLVKYGGVWVDATNLCRRPLDAWLPRAAASGFFAFFGDSQSPEHNGIPHIISSFLVSAPQHTLAVKWLGRTIDHWSLPFKERPDLEYLWVNKLFRQMVSIDEGDLEAHEEWIKVPTIGCSHGESGPMWFYSSPEELKAGARLFERMLAPPTSELKDALENDHEVPMWKLAFREQLDKDSAYWLMYKRTVEQANAFKADSQKEIGRAHV